MVVTLDIQTVEFINLSPVFTDSEGNRWEKASRDTKFIEVTYSHRMPVVCTVLEVKHLGIVSLTDVGFEVSFFVSKGKYLHGLINTND